MIEDEDTLRIYERLVIQLKGDLWRRRHLPDFGFWDALDRITGRAKVDTDAFASEIGTYVPRQSFEDEQPRLRQVYPTAFLMRFHKEVGSDAMDNFLQHVSDDMERRMAEIGGFHNPFLERCGCRDCRRLREE